MPPPLIQRITVSQAAQELSYTPDHVRYLCRKGLLDAQYIGVPPLMQWQITADSVAAYKVLPHKRGPKPASRNLSM